MCGICGVYHYRAGAPDLDLVHRQQSVIRHRGPDDWEVWSEGPVALAHRRLSIVDLSPGGHQPMPNEDGSLRVTYNGELYGWPEIRSGLAARGHRFRGHSDTEALLHLYEEDGDGLFEHLRGMFAFGLWDAPRRRLLVGRDRLGIKPLYWHDDGTRIAFASELKALMIDDRVERTVDERAIADYLAFQYVPCPGTIWKGVNKLPPGHFLVADADGVRVRRYWSLPAETDESLTEEVARERLRAVLAEAVRLRLVADVPLGAFLSGGIDSSIVVALMSQAAPEPVKTFSIGFEEESFSELPHARRVAAHLGTDHREFTVKADALSLLPTLVWQNDEPFADPSTIPTYYVSEMARRHVTVALSGDGGDESWGGYETYAFGERYARWDRIPRPLRQGLAGVSAAFGNGSDLARRLRRLGAEPVDRHLEVMAFFAPGEIEALAGHGLRAALAAHDPLDAPRRVHREAAARIGPIAALLTLDALTYMSDDVLTKVDRASMIHSLEVRVPLIDHKVMEFVARLPFHYKRRNGVGKWLLKESVRDLLPTAILARRKQGFAVPLERWFGGGFGTLAREVLLDPRARGRGWIEPREVERLLSGPAADPERRAKQIFALVVLELWAQTYLDRPRSQLEGPLGGFAGQPTLLEARHRAPGAAPDASRAR
jgi:asparagine synthase (glutamine-hydrolysing)